MAEEMTIPWLEIIYIWYVLNTTVKEYVICQIFEVSITNVSGVNEKYSKKGE